MYDGHYHGDSPLSVIESQSVEFLSDQSRRVFSSGSLLAVLPEGGAGSFPRHDGRVSFIEVDLSQGEVGWDPVDRLPPLAQFAITPNAQLPFLVVVQEVELLVSHSVKIIMYLLEYGTDYKGNCSITVCCHWRGLYMSVSLLTGKQLQRRY